MLKEAFKLSLKRYIFKKKEKKKVRKSTTAYVNAVLVWGGNTRTGAGPLER